MTKLKLYIWKGTTGTWYADVDLVGRRLPASGSEVGAAIAWTSSDSFRETLALGLALLEQTLADELERQDP